MGVSWFFVAGSPAPKGSTRAFVVRGTNRAIVTETNPRTRPWAALITDAARTACAGVMPCATGPVAVTLAFRLPRPASLPKRRVSHPIGRRLDLDKLTRAALDALTGVCWTDDGQVVQLAATKHYADLGETPGLHVCVQPFAPKETR